MSRLVSALMVTSMIAGNGVAGPSLLRASNGSVPAGVNEPLDVPPTPRGWTVRHRSGSAVFRPEEKSEPLQKVEVRFHDRTLLGGARVDDWLRAEGQSTRAPRGEFTGAMAVRRLNGNVSAGQRTFRNLRGKEGIQVVTAVSVDGLMVRRVTATVYPASLYGTYGAAINGLTSDLLDLEKAAAKREGRGLRLEVAPPKVTGIDAGGPILPGRYVGSCVYKGEALRPVDLVLHGNGEFEFLAGFDGRDAAGRASYSEATGRLDLAGDLRNSRNNPDEDFCVFGKGIDGTALVYAEEDRGFAPAIYRLRFQGPSDRRSPSETERIEAAAKAEALRYKWVTEPGKGVRPEELAGVLYAADGRWRGATYHLEEFAYVLLADGRVMDGVPVPPDQLDLPASLSREPNRWGTWKREGEGYLFAWPVRPGEFAPPRGSLRLGRPVPKGSRLDGRWGSASSWSDGLGGGGASFWGVDFTKGGRFTAWRNGVASSGGSLSPGSLPFVGVGWDDEGSSTVVSGGGVGGGVTSKNGSTLADRSGTYEFDGYAVTLRYDSGRVRRLPAFFTGEGESGLWFDDGALRRKSPEAKKD